MQILERENAILRGENGRICQKMGKKGSQQQKKENPPLYGREGTIGCPDGIRTQRTFLFNPLTKIINDL